MSRSRPRRRDVAYRETIRRAPSSTRRYKRQTGGHGQFADIKVEIRPLPRGAGFRFVNKVVGGVGAAEVHPRGRGGPREYLQRGPLG